MNIIILGVFMIAIACISGGVGYAMGCMYGHEAFKNELKIDGELSIDFSNKDEQPIWGLNFYIDPFDGRDREVIVLQTKIKRGDGSCE